MPLLVLVNAMALRLRMALNALEVTAQTEKRRRSDTDGDKERWSIANPYEVSDVLRHCPLVFQRSRR